jgi:hypothetical protein
LVVEQVRRQPVDTTLVALVAVLDPLLGPLQNNGGPTQTMALLPGSPAIGHGDNAKAPTTDQRGITRITGPGEFTDIGAFEV